MDIGNILNVAVSLLFVFVLMSLIASTVQEMAAGMWNSRGRYLRAAIGQMLGDPQLSGVAGAVYRHPLIAGLLSPGVNVPKLQWLRRLLPFVAPRQPSNIPPKLFADVVMDILNRSGAMTTGSMAPALAALWRKSGAAGDKMHAAVMEWYSAAMERQTGRFKRNTQRTLFGYGLLLAVVLNVDTLRVAETLWKGANSQQLAALTAQAEAFADKHDPSRNSKATVATFDDLLTTLNHMDLPIGWGTANGCAVAAHVLANGSGWLGRTLYRLVPCALCPGPPEKASAAADEVGAARWLGWLLTAFAVSLGAQFWFDMIGKVISLRSSGPVSPPPAAPAT